MRDHSENVLTHNISSQHGAVFLELWLARSKENTSFSDAILFAWTAERASGAVSFLTHKNSSLGENDRLCDPERRENDLFAATKRIVSDGLEMRRFCASTTEIRERICVWKRNVMDLAHFW